MTCWGQLQARGVDFWCACASIAQWVQEQEAATDCVDRARRVTWAGLVQLGVQGDGPRVRVTNHGGRRIDPARHHAGCRGGATEVLAQPTSIAGRWNCSSVGSNASSLPALAAESPRGCAPVYLALIAAQFALLYTGNAHQAPMEAIQFISSVGERGGTRGTRQSTGAEKKLNMDTWPRCPRMPRGGAASFPAADHPSTRATLPVP